MNRIYNRMELLTSWPGMKQELEEYIKRFNMTKEQNHSK